VKVLGAVELALGQFCKQLVLSQSRENQFHVLQVVFGDSTEYENIVDINHEEVIQIFPENIIHHCLEGTGGIFKSKMHYQKLKQSISRSNASLWDIGVLNPNLVICTAEVQGCEILCTLKSIEYLVYPWYGALIFDGKLIKCTVVQTHLQASIRLGRLAPVRPTGSHSV
jgi:hypothetical protein